MRVGKRRLTKENRFSPSLFMSETRNSKLEIRNKFEFFLKIFIKSKTNTTKTKLNIKNSITEI